MENKKNMNPILLGVLTALAAVGGYMLVHVLVFKKDIETQDWIISIGIGVGVVVANTIQAKRKEKKEKDDIIDK